MTTCPNCSRPYDPALYRWGCPRCTDPGREAPVVEDGSPQAQESITEFIARRLAEGADEDVIEWESARRYPRGYGVRN